MMKKYASQCLKLLAYGVLYGNGTDVRAAPCIQHMLMVSAEDRIVWPASSMLLHSTLMCPRNCEEHCPGCHSKRNPDVRSVSGQHSAGCGGRPTFAEVET